MKYSTGMEYDVLERNFLLHIICSKFVLLSAPVRCWFTCSIDWVSWHTCLKFFAFGKLSLIQLLLSADTLIPYFANCNSFIMQCLSQACNKHFQALLQQLESQDSRLAMLQETPRAEQGRQCDWTLMSTIYQYSVGSKTAPTIAFCNCKLHTFTSSTLVFFSK